MTDRRVFLIVVGFLGAALLLSLVAIAGLAGADKSSPDILENIAVGTLTGLAGLLARGPSSEPQEVVVRQPPGDPVPVDDQAGHVLVALLLIMGGAVLALVGLAGALSGGVHLLEVAFILVGLGIAALGVQRAT